MPSSLQTALINPTKTIRVPSFTTNSGFNNEKVGWVILGFDGTSFWIIRPEERGLKVGF